MYLYSQDITNTMNAMYSTIYSDNLQLCLHIILAIVRPAALFNIILACLFFVLVTVVVFALVHFYGRQKVLKSTVHPHSEECCCYLCFVIASSCCHLEQ